MRPLPSGQLSLTYACFLFVVAILLGGGLIFYAERTAAAFFCIAGYLLINILYSLKLKNLPIWDIVILAAGFVIRVFYGSVFCDIPVSNWLFLCTMSGALFMGIGKRRNELRHYNSGKTRLVLKFYSEEFLDRNMYLSGTLSIVFYSLWCTTTSEPWMIVTVPLILLLLMQYSYAVEAKSSNGDPVNVILCNRSLLCLALFYALVVFVIYYGKIFNECV